MSITDSAAAYVFGLLAYFQAIPGRVQALANDSRDPDVIARDWYFNKQAARGQTATVIAVVTVGIVAIIGILIYSQVQSALPAPNNPSLNNSSQQVTSGFGNAMQLVPVVLIILVASLVIGVVQRFG